MIITLFGRIPSKKNSKRVMCQGGFPKVLPSEKYEDWHLDASWQLKAMRAQLPKTPIEKASITITFYPPDNIKADLSNKAESVMDLLVDCLVLSDDNWFVCGDLHLKFGGVDKLKPRAVIEINTHGK